MCIGYTPDALDTFLKQVMMFCAWCLLPIVRFRALGCMMCIRKGQRGRVPPISAERNLFFDLELGCAVYTKLQLNSTALVEQTSIQALL
jgi:hypothetical protein